MDVHVHFKLVCKSAQNNTTQNTNNGIDNVQLKNCRDDLTASEIKTPEYCMAGNIGGKIIWRLAVEAKNSFISAKFNIIRWCVGVYVRHNYHYVSSSESWEMTLLKYFSCDTSVPKQSSSLTQKEREVASDFVSKAEEEVQHVGVTLCTQSKRNI